jgi:hypothetical protein
MAQFKLRHQGHECEWSYPAQLVENPVFLWVEDSPAISRLTPWIIPTSPRGGPGARRPEPRWIYAAVPRDAEFALPTWIPFKPRPYIRGMDRYIWLQCSPEASENLMRVETPLIMDWEERRQSWQFIASTMDAAKWRSNLHLIGIDCIPDVTEWEF